MSAVCILLTGLLLMGLHSEAAECPSKVHHRQMLLLVSGAYRRFILSILSWNIVKDQKTNLINFRRTWRFRTKLLSLGKKKKTRPVCHQLSGPFHMVMPVRSSPFSFERSTLIFNVPFFFCTLYQKLVLWPFQNMSSLYWVDQKVHLGFSVTCYGEIWKKFLANQVY